MLINAAFQAEHAGKSYVMHSNEFGYDLYISHSENNGICVTDTIDEAEVFSVDNDAIKIEYHRNCTGYDLKPIIV